VAPESQRWLRERMVYDAGERAMAMRAPRGQPTGVRDPSGRWAHRYGAGNLVSQVDGVGVELTFAHEVRGLLPRGCDGHTSRPRMPRGNQGTATSPQVRRRNGLRPPRTASRSFDQLDPDTLAEANEVSGVVGDQRWNAVRQQGGDDIGVDRHVVSTNSALSPVVAIEVFWSRLDLCRPLSDA